jgi:hypothetical protein
MGVSTDGQICFGVAFDEGFEFPWDAEQFDGDPQRWWRSVNGYSNPNWDPFDEHGNYKPGVTHDDPRRKTFWQHGWDWDKANPVPIILVNYCSGDVPMYIVAVPGPNLSCSRGYPEAFDPSTLTVTEEAAVLTEFLTKYEIEFEGPPKWYLSSYWG